MKKIKVNITNTNIYAIFERSTMTLYINQNHKRNSNVTVWL